MEDGILNTINGTNKKTMYQVTGRNGNYYAKEVSDPRDVLADMIAYISSRDVVIYVNQLEDLEDIGIDPSNVEEIN